MHKRLFDIAVSAFTLILLSPVMLVIAWMIHRHLGSPVIFRQERPGLNGVPFNMIKFRTMRDAVDATGQPLSDAERITRLGKFLRSCSLDELPELWNVLKGDMSLVGPRPLLMEYLPLYTAEQQRRHDVLPGITGWSQVNGRNAINWEKKFELDIWYVNNQSFWLDLKILIKTIQTVLARTGIAADGQVTTTKFKGLKNNERKN